MRLGRRRLPDAVTAVELLPGERRLAWGLTLDGRAVVATAERLLLPDAVLTWPQVERAGWQPPRLTVAETAEVEGAGTSHVVELAEAGDLPGIVRARVTSSIGWSDQRRLTPAGTVRLVGRRVPGRDALLWQLVFGRDTDPHDPLLRAQAEQLLAEVRATLG